MFQSSSPSETREIYTVNNLMRKYRLNYYYSLRKDALFIFEGRSVKAILYPAYVLSALGGLTFIFSFIFKSVLQDHPVAMFSIYAIATLSLIAGIYILYDFSQKIKYAKTKTMITRKGISFRDKNGIEFWPIGKIKNLEVVFTANKKDVMKPGIDNSLRKEGRVTAYNYIGQVREVISIHNSDRTELKDDLEMAVKSMERFISINQKVQLADEAELAVKELTQKS